MADTLKSSDRSRNPGNSKITVAVVTVSDLAYQGIYKDESGPKVVDAFSSETYDIVSRSIVPDDLEDIKNELLRFADNEHVDVIVTIGGAGCSSRDMTPDATASVIEKEVPGIADAIRQKPQNPKFLLSRGISGIRKETLILNLPGNPESARIAIDTVIDAIPHCIKTIQTQKPRKKRTPSAGLVGQESVPNRPQKARK